MKLDGNDHLPGGTEGTGAWEPIVRPGLDVVFVGFNPSLPAWRTGHHYANPGNRFYHLLFESGLTPRRLRPAEDRSLPDFGIGLIDLIERPSARADHIPPTEFAAAAPALLARLRELQPSVVCCNGIKVFRHLFGTAPAQLGLQPDLRIGGSAVFVMPSTSGLANRWSAERLAAFRELAAWLHSPP